MIAQTGNQTVDVRNASWGSTLDITTLFDALPGWLAALELDCEPDEDEGLPMSNEASELTAAREAIATRNTTSTTTRES